MQRSASDFSVDQQMTWAEKYEFCRSLYQNYREKVDYAARTYTERKVREVPDEMLEGKIAGLPAKQFIRNFVYENAKLQCETLSNVRQQNGYDVGCSSYGMMLDADPFQVMRDAKARGRVEVTIPDDIAEYPKPVKDYYNTTH